MLRTAPRWLKVLLVGQVVNAAGSLAWLYLTLYLVDDRGLATGAAGAVTATYGVGVIGGNLTGGSLGAWVLACAAFPLAPPAALAPLALLSGAAGGCGRPLMSALVATGLPPDRRREGISLSRAASNLGTVLGPPLGGLLAVTRFDLVFVLDAVTSALLLVAVARWCPAPVQTRSPGTPRSLLHALRTDARTALLLLTVLMVDTTYRLLYTVLPLLLSDRGAPPLAYGLSVSLNCVVIVALEPRIARRLAHRDAARVIAAGYAVVGLGWLLLGAAPVVLGAFAAVLVVTVGEMLYKPTATARAADLAPAGMAGRYQSAYAAASLGGMLLSPLLGTALYAAAPRLVWPAAGLLALLAAGVLARSAGASPAVASAAAPSPAAPSPAAPSPPAPDAAGPGATAGGPVAAQQSGGSAGAR